MRRVSDFMDEHIYPAVPIYEAAGDDGERWKVIPIVEELKAKARADRPLEHVHAAARPARRTSTTRFQFEGVQLTNLEYAPICEMFGRVGFAREVFNCSAPDTGNMEVLNRFGTLEQKERWLRPLMNGEIRSAFLMTEPQVASSDATNIETRIERDGDDYVINGRKWWSSGVGDPRCKVAIVMGKTNPNAAAAPAAVADPGAAGRSGDEGRAHAAGVRLRRRARTATPRCCSRTSACRSTNLLLGEGRGFEISPGAARAGPHPPLHAHHRRGRGGAGEDVPAADEPQGVRQVHLRAFGVGAAGRRRPHRHRDEPPALPEGRRHDGQGRQQESPGWRSR